MTRPWVLVLFAACRSKTSVVDAAAPAPSALSTTVVDAAPDVAPHQTASVGWNVMSAVAVSSRVDNGTESPEALFDGDTSTAWSSRTGDLVGAWVAFRLDARADVRAVALTVGMTKSAELFEENIRIAEVQVSFNDVVVADHFKLDTESRALQPIPIAALGKGDLKITVQAIQPGTKAMWREVTISEVELRGPSGTLRTDPFRHSVGSFDPKPRGVLGIVPEDRVPLGCLVAMPSVPRVWCAVGQAGNHWKSASLVSIDKDGMKVVAPLMNAASSEARISYADWLRVERDVRGAVTLPKSTKEIPWGGSVEVDGATLRQRPTSDAADDEFTGVLEVRFAGGASFTKLFDEIAPRPSYKPSATLLPIGTRWLVERSATHGSEGWFMSEAEAVLCDLRAHECTTWTAPPDKDDGSR